MIGAAIRGDLCILQFGRHRLNPPTQPCRGKGRYHRRGNSSDKRMARPVGKWFELGGLSSLRKRIRPFGLRRWPRWRSARSGPRKGAGIEVPFDAIGFQHTGRLSGHLALASRRRRGPACLPVDRIRPAAPASRKCARAGAAPTRSVPSSPPARQQRCLDASATAGREARRQAACRSCSLLAGTRGRPGSGSCADIGCRAW